MDSQSLLDQYPFPGQLSDSAELEKAKYLALMRMGLGLAGREPIGRAAGAGIATYSTMEEGARRNADQKMQEMQARMKYAIGMKKDAEEQALRKQIEALYSGKPNLDRMGSGGPTPENLAQVLPDNIQKYTDQIDLYLRNNMPEKAKIVAEVRKDLIGKWNTDPKPFKDVNGNVVTLQFNDDGRSKIVPYEVARPLHFGSTGGMTNVAFNDLTGSQVSSGLPATPTPSDQISAGHLAETRRHNQVTESATADMEPMTADAVTNAAARYNIDGTLPAMGMGKSAASMRSQILNQAAALATGTAPEDQRIAQIGNKAATSALTQLSRQQTMVGAFEKTFNKNADLVLEFSKKVDPSGVPIINKWINAGKRSVVGDPDIAAYDAAVKSVANEYTKIINGSMGNTVLAEGEIKKVEGLLNAAQSPQQVIEVVQFMRRETQNRMQGFSDQTKELKASMKGTSTAPTKSGELTATERAELELLKNKYGR